MYKIIEKAPCAPDYSGWYGATIIRTPVYCLLPNGKEVFLLGKISDVMETHKKNDHYIVRDIEEQSKEIENFVEQLKAHDGKWFDRNHTWFWQSKEVHGLSPLEFIDWVKSKGYAFNDMTEIILNEDGQGRFHGNLDKYSCAFCYDIADGELIQKLCSFAKKNNIPIIN